MPGILKSFKKITSRWIIFILEQLLALASFVTAILIIGSIVPKDNYDISSIATLLCINALLTTLGMMLFNTHSGIIRYSELKDIYTVIKFSLFQLISWLVIFPFTQSLFQSLQAPLMTLLINFATISLYMIGFRLLVKEVYARGLRGWSQRERVLIYGAGQVGMATKKAVELDTRGGKRLAAFIDDDPNKINKSISGVTIISGDPSSLRNFIIHNSIKEIIIATNISLERKSNLTPLCAELNIKLSSVPPLHQWTNGGFHVNQLKEVTIESLLERDVIQVLNEKSIEEFEGATVLVTGAAGSIGSEICRQLCKYDLQRLILLDQSETGLHDIMHELNSKYDSIDFCMELASIRDEQRVSNIMHHYKPQYVFHAAAYKHVPILEYFPSEVILTNVKGTRNLADAALASGVKKFVMISTDKAVNPTNIMGATKRIAEMYVQSKNEEGGTHFITTRFGNVLGSNGSVVPLFKKQIQMGGPVTVTHPDITRYFMTIPEASNLVLEAGVMGNGGEIYVFDMGKPVKILDLATKMIELSGMRPGEDIKIVFQGLRPGEKMYEELFKENENLVSTHHPKIMKANRCATDPAFNEEMLFLISLADEEKPSSLRKQICKLVPEYNYEKLENAGTVRILRKGTKQADDNKIWKTN
jgi:FlaA1/EpsC-like NDP-sugar epimerase